MLTKSNPKKEAPMPALQREIPQQIDTFFVSKEVNDIERSAEL